MPTYQRWIEATTHYLHEVEASSPEEAKKLFETNMSTCVDEQSTVHLTDIEEVDE